MSKKPVCPPRPGTVLVLAAVLMFVLCGIVAFAIDTGYIVLTKTELQRAADAGAMAGAHVVLSGPSSARQVAESYSEQHSAAGDPVAVLPVEDIQLGLWDDETGTFQVLHGANERRARAVRVTCRVSNARGNAAELFFAPILGRDTAELTATATAVIERSRCGLILGLNSIYCEDGLTDSYESSLGSYASQTPGEEGHICSNGSIQLNSGTLIHGNASPGRGQQTTMGPGAVVSGSTRPLLRRFTVKPISTGDAAAVNDNDEIPSNYFSGSGDLYIAGTDHVTLPGGTYYVSGSFTIAGKATLEFTGPTEIYIEGNVSISGNGIVNRTQSPANLKIYPMGATADFAGNAALHAVVYAPTSDVLVRGNGGIYGSVIGETLYMNGNTAIHADKSLPFDEYTVLSARMVE